MIDDKPDARPFATPRVAAGALFVDRQGAVLMVRPTYKTFWDIPGGYVEAGESPLDACTREVREELGIEVTLGALLAVDWAPHPEEGDKLLFVFDGGVVTPEQQATMRFADGELDQMAFLPADDLDQVTVARLARRLRAALDAKAIGVGAYLQNGTTTS
ncbi:NUDIX domain-containing protein [Micromonosporaceae bacterium Da 78-11]